MVITNLGTFFLIRFRLYVASTMELFSKNSQRILAVNYFRKKAPSQMFSLVLNTPHNYIILVNHMKIEFNGNCIINTAETKFC